MRGGCHGRAAQIVPLGLAARMPQSFRTSRRVEFRDTDAAGIVHFRSSSPGWKPAEHELLRSLGLSVVARGRTGTITWPRVAARCDYQGPVRFEETVDIEVRVTRIGGKSVTYEFQFTGPRGAVAIGEMTMVCCRSRIGRHLPLDRHSRADPPGPGHLQVELKRAALAARSRKKQPTGQRVRGLCDFGHSRASAAKNAKAGG